MSKDEANETRAKERWMERQSDDQVLVGLMGDAHICSRSPIIFTQCPSLCEEEGEGDGGCDGRMGCHYKRKKEGGRDGETEE